MSPKSSRMDRLKGLRRPWRYAVGTTALAGALVPTMLANSSAAAAARPAGTPKLSYSGTITFYAGGYNPPISGVKVAPGVVADPAMQDAANAFHKMYPNITIKFLPATADIGSGQWYITNASAGTLPDVSEVPGYYVNVTLPTGLYQDLLPDFYRPNPFIPGNKSWISTMNATALRIDAVPGNTPGTSGVFVVNGDWGGIGFYYNKKLFSEAGISSPPTTWNQLVTDSQQIDERLGSKGVYAGASFAPVIYNWFAHYFQANYLGLQKMKEIYAIPADLTSGYQSYFYAHDGDWLNPADNPALTAWWPLGKELTDTWIPKDVDVPENTSSSIPNGVTYFLAQQVAYAFVSGYAIPREVASLPKSQQFPVGYFELDSPKAFIGTSKYATTLPVWQDNGGPETSFQFGIASPTADHTMTSAKTAAALAWLQFISTPKWDSEIVNGEGNALPIIKGATTTSSLQPILNALTKASGEYYPMALFDSVTASSFATIDGLYLEYIDGYVPLSKAIAEYDSDASSIIQQFNLKNAPLVSKLTAYENKKLGLK